MLTAHFRDVYIPSLPFHPLVSFPHSITFTRCQSCLSRHLHRMPAHPPLCTPPTPTPHRAAPLSPCNICLSFGMKRKCLPVGSQVAHPEGWLRLMPVIQLCWFTPRTHRGVGDYTVLCWRGREADRQNEREGEWERENRGGGGGRRMSCGRWSPVDPLLALHLLVPHHTFHYLSI